MRGTGPLPVGVLLLVAALPGDSTALLGDGIVPPLAAGPLPSRISCLGAKREGRTDVLNLSDSIGLTPLSAAPADAAVLATRSSTKPPAASAATPRLLVSPMRAMMEAVRGSSPLSIVLIATRPLRTAARAPSSAGPLLVAGLVLPSGGLLDTAKGEAATGSVMAAGCEPECCTEQPDRDADVAAAAAAAAAAMASGGSVITTGSAAW